MPIFSAAPCSKCGKPGYFSERVSVVTGRRSRRGVCDSCRDGQRRSRRKARLEAERARDRRYMGEFRKSGYYDRNPGKRIFSKPWARKNPEKYLYLTMQRRRSGKGDRPKYRLTMTYDEFLIEIGGKMPRRCPVLGIRLFISPKERSDHIPTIDRIENERPYEKGNVAVISRRANIIKNGGTADEHRRIADWMDAMAKMPPRP